MISAWEIPTAVKRPAVKEKKERKAPDKQRARLWARLGPALTSRRKSA
jgi:hypothetical protein